MNLLNVQDLADKAEECDRKALLAKCVELRDTFIDLAEQYRALARKVKASQRGSFAEQVRRLAEQLTHDRAS